MRRNIAGIWRLNEVLTDGRYLELPWTNYILEMQREGTFGDGLTFFNAEIIIVSTLGRQALTKTVSPTDKVTKIRILANFTAVIIIIL